MNDDAWSDIRKAMREEKKIEKKLVNGIYCFKVITIRKPIEVENDFKFAKNMRKTEFSRNLVKITGKPVKYNVYKVGVRVWYWKERTPMDKLIGFKGKLIHTFITESILCLIRSQLDLLIDYKIPEPELILYWKPNAITVKYTFIYEKDYEKHKKYIESEDVEYLKENFYWMGRKEYFDENELIRRYQNE